MSVTIPNEVLKCLKCAECDKYLTVSPVYSTRKGNICGRCPSPHFGMPKPNIPYEAVATLLTFPCSYKAKGCTENLTWNQSRGHEDRCMYRSYECPKLPPKSCDWKEPRYQIYDHFSKSHPELIIQKEDFVLDVSKNNSVNMIVSVLGEFFLFNTKCNIRTEKISCGVSYIQKQNNQSGKFCFELIVLIDSEPITFFKRKEIVSEMFNETLEINLKNLKPAENILNGKIRIVPIEPQSATTRDTQLINELECPVCLEYMVPPIYNCAIGHSICGDCRSKLEKCPLCQTEMTSVRNYTLENLTMTLHYPCKYKDKGCTFKGNPTEIREHESKCQMANAKCPFERIKNCSWSGEVTEVYKHNQQEHSEATWLMNDSEITQIIDLSDQNKLLSVVSCFGEVLIFYAAVKSSFSSLSILWAVQLTRPVNDGVKYMFRLEFIDQKHGRNKLVIDKESNYNATIDALTLKNNSTEIPIQLLLPFLNKATMEIKYRFKIYPHHSEEDDCTK